jgi:hypothetical protein
VLANGDVMWCDDTLVYSGIYSVFVCNMLDNYLIHAEVEWCSSERPLRFTGLEQHILFAAAGYGYARHWSFTSNGSLLFVSNSSEFVKLLVPRNYLHKLRQMLLAPVLSLTCISGGLPGKLALQRSPFRKSGEDGRARYRWLPQPETRRLRICCWYE